MAFDPPLSDSKRRAADRRHPGEVSKVLAVVHGAPATYIGVGWNTPINAGFVLRPAGDGAAVHGVLGPGPRGPGRATRPWPRGERAPARGDGHDDRRPRLGGRPILAGHVALGAAARGSATARSRRWPSPRAAWRSPAPTSRPRAPAGSRARSAAASPRRRTCTGSSPPGELVRTRRVQDLRRRSLPGPLAADVRAHARPELVALARREREQPLDPRCQPARRRRRPARTRTAPAGRPPPRARRPPRPDPSGARRAGAHRRRRPRPPPCRTPRRGSRAPPARPWRRGPRARTDGRAGR